MEHCCEHKTEALVRLRARQGRVLQWVLAVNAVMFLVEVIAGFASRSTALLGDSLDMFGDAAVYGVTLYVLSRGPLWRARASLLKGGVMLLFGLGVLVDAVVRTAALAPPDAATMGAIGALALAANVGCLLLLLRHRTDDINMRSAWICSRNDIIANVAVISAAAIVRATGARWPDAVVGGAIALLFVSSAIGVLRAGIAAHREVLRHHHSPIKVDREGRTVT